MNRQQVVAKTRSAAKEIKARPQFAVMSVAAIVLLLWVFMSSGNVSDRAERLTGIVESQQVLIDKLAVALDEARAQGAAVPAPEVIAAEVPDVEVSPAVGATGERGEAGPVGDAGIPGVTGSAGIPGVAGGVGEQGSIGPRGLPGVAGVDGASGADGSMGPPGPAGTDGSPGADGADGTPGQPGADGAPGAQGPPGATPQTMTCTPSNPLDLSQPWSCVVTS